MLLLDICLSATQAVIAIVGIAAVVGGVTYYLATLSAGTKVDCAGSYNDPVGIGLQPAIAKAMIAEYVQTAGLGDTCSVWFPLESVQRFACTISTGALQNCGISDTSTLGIRVYFAKYPLGNTPIDAKNNPIGKVPMAPGSTTLIMVPTYSPDGSTNRDFDPTMAAAADGPRLMSSIFLGDLPETLYVMNHGTQADLPGR
jgi:hypothetical protein